MKGKLPKIWVSFDPPRISTEHFWAAHRYTPAKPAKTKKCKCAGRCISGPWKFCPYCGGILAK